MKKSYNYIHNQKRTLEHYHAELTKNPKKEILFYSCAATIGLLIGMISTGDFEKTIYSLVSLIASQISLPSFFNTVFSFVESFFTFIIGLIPTVIFTVITVLIRIMLCGIVVWKSLKVLMFICTPREADIIHQKLYDVGFKNGSNETPFLVAKYKDETDSDVTIYEFDANGKSRDKWENNKSDLLTALSVNYIGSITDSENHQRIYVPTFPQAPAKKISMRDDCLSKVENLLCVGRTGTGKSYALSVILGQAALYNPDSSITVCDFKNSSFMQLADTPNYYGFTEVFDGIVKVYNEFFERVGSPTNERNMQAHYLLIDEYAALISYLSSKDKKKAEEVKGMVGDMLMMGRSLNIRVFVGMQRADSAHFKEGARDQFGAILALGNLSRIQRDMLFPDDKDKMTVRNGRGQGYLFIDGQDIKRVVIEAIDDFDTLNAVIRQAMNH